MHGKEIERKFLIKIMPDLSNIKPIGYERYFIYIDGRNEIRVQKKGEKFEFERKSSGNILSSNKIKFEITENEFEKLKLLSVKSIERESYELDEEKRVSIKIYKGEHVGLKRAEFEFSSEDEAQSFIPYEWLGEEITDSPLGKDSKLLSMTQDEFKKILNI